jgi:alpha-glucuronidase
MGRTMQRGIAGRSITQHHHSIAHFHHQHRRDDYATAGAFYGVKF